MSSDIHILRAKYKLFERNKKDFDEKIIKLSEEIQLLSLGKQFLIDFSEFSRESIKERLEGLANTALKAIYTDTVLIFKLIGDKQKRGLVYVPYLESDGVLTPLEKASGGGVLDIVSLSLRISFLKFFEGSLRQTLILDEPFKNLDTERLVLAVEWLKMIAKQLNIQFIIVTHITTLIDRADMGYKFQKIDGVTQVAQAR